MSMCLMVFIFVMTITNLKTRSNCGVEGGGRYFAVIKSICIVHFCYNIGREDQ